MEGEEKRKFSRWYLKEEEKINLTFSEFKEGIKVIDISAGGIKIISHQPLEVGKIVTGRLTLAPMNLPFFMKEIGPYFIKGKVKRVEETNQGWKIALEFEKVSTSPLA